MTTFRWAGHKRAQLHIHGRPPRPDPNDRTRLLPGSPPQMLSFHEDGNDGVYETDDPWLVDTVMRSLPWMRGALKIDGSVDGTAPSGTPSLYRALAPMDRRLRVGIFTAIPPYYSGGRLLLYQYGWCLASTGGAEVFVMANGLAGWMNDYPPLPNYHVIDIRAQGRPPDLDLLMANRGRDLREMIEYHREHPHSAALAVNFETPNWVKELAPGLAKLIAVEGKAQDGYLACDQLFSCSKEGGKWLQEKLLEDFGAEYGREVLYLPGAVNTEALAVAETLPPDHTMPNRPYAVWCSRRSQHKGIEVAVEAVWGLDTPFDLVVISNVAPRPETPQHSLHKLHTRNVISDVDKYRLMLHAHTVLCPSLFEGYGLVPGEALASGVVPVVYDLPVLREVYGDRLYYVPHGNTGAFKAAVKQVAHEPKNEADAEEAKQAYGLGALRERIVRFPYHNIGRVSVSVHMILYWGFFPEALESWYPHADQIIVAYGPVQLVKGKGVKPDDSLERLKAFPDPDGKIEIHERPVWKDKLEMHDFCCRRIRGNRMVNTAGDLIWTGIEEWINDPEIFAACPRIVNFWNDNEHYIAYDEEKEIGGCWGWPVKPYGTWTPHNLYTYWKPSYRIRHHGQACDAAGYDLNTADHKELRRQACDRHPNTCIYHLGNLLASETLKAKAEFYHDRDGAVNEVRMNGEVLPVTWPLPPIVQRALARLDLSQTSMPVPENSSMPFVSWLSPETVAKPGEVDADKPS